VLSVLSVLPGVEKFTSRVVAGADAGEVAGAEVAAEVALKYAIVCLS